MVQGEVQREGAMVQDVWSSRAAHATRTNEREQAQAKRCDAICELLPACPATTTIFLILSHTLQSLTHHLQRLLLSLRRRGTAVLTLTPFKPLMTSMTSPPSLARDETVTVINCDAHVDTTNHTPTTPTSQARPTERPAGTQGHEPCLRLCPFPSFQRLRAGNGSNKRHHRAQSKRADRSTIRPQGYALLCLCLRLLNCPIPSHFQPNYITFFADRARRFRAQEHIH